jgi:hypothetical protein
MDLCVVNVFSSITNKMQRYTMYLFLRNSVHVSGGSSANHQELKIVYTGSSQAWQVPDDVYTETCRAFDRNKYIV